MTFCDHLDRVTAESLDRKKILKFENTSHEIEREADIYLAKLALNLDKVKNLSKKIIHLENSASTEKRPQKSARSL